MLSVAALVAMVLLWLFLKKTYLGTAIRAISQDRGIMPLMGVSPARIYLTTSAIGGALGAARDSNGLAVGVRGLLRGGGAVGYCTTRFSRQETKRTTWA